MVVPSVSIWSVLNPGKNPGDRLETGAGGAA
jgi:hypothetical protein